MSSPLPIPCLSAPILVKSRGIANGTRCRRREKDALRLRSAERQWADPLEDCTDPLTGEIVPLIVVIDDGPGYKSAEFMAFIASGPELRHARTRHYAPEANRVVQRFNRTLKCEHLNRREITDGITQGQHLVDRVRHLQPGSQLRSNGDATLCVCVSDQGHSLLRVGQVFVRPLESPRRWSALASWRGRAGIGGLGVTDRMTVEGHQKGMVDQLRERGAVRSDPVARGFGAIPRHRFLPSMPLDRVYGFDEAIPTHFDGAGVPISSSSAPIIMAVMLEMLAIEPGQRVLEVGAGTGYNAALLGHLVGEEGSVTSIDIDPDVTAQAAANLDEAGITGVRIVTGDGWLGELGDHFDREMVTAECWDLSPHWVGQLAEGGILVLPLWLRPGLTLAVAFEKRDGVLASRSLAGCGFMPLRGPHGGSRRRTLVPAPPWDSRMRRGRGPLDRGVRRGHGQTPGTARGAPGSSRVGSSRATILRGVERPPGARYDRFDLLLSGRTRCAPLSRRAFRPKLPEPGGRRRRDPPRLRRSLLLRASDRVPLRTQAA